MSKINDIYFFRKIKGITTHIAWHHVIYSAFVFLKEISKCNLSHCNTVHTSYLIAYPVRDMTFSKLLTSDNAQPMSREIMGYMEASTSLIWIGYF